MVASLALLIVAAPAAPSVPTQTRQKPKATAPTLGTVQMPGDKGKVGTTYQLGSKGSELHFNLESAAFETIHPAPEETLVAGPKERLLSLTFTVQNPLNREQRLGSSEFHFTAVSPEDENYEFRGSLLHPTKGTALSQSLKPAQKVKCTVVFPIYAEGPVTKLIVQRGSAPVVRYDLTGKVKKVDSIFTTDGIDLADKASLTTEGFTKGVLFGPLQMALVSGAMTTDPIQGQRPIEGERYWTMKVRFTNPMLKPSSVGFQYYALELLTEDGEKLPWNSTLLNAGMDNYLSQDLAPGDSVVAAYYFRVPTSKRPAKLRITHNNSKRTVEIPAAW